MKFKKRLIACNDQGKSSLMRLFLMNYLPLRQMLIFLTIIKCYQFSVFRVIKGIPQILIENYFYLKLIIIFRR